MPDWLRALRAASSSLVGATARAQAPAAAGSEPSAAPAGLATETVDLLGGRNAGDLDVVARGHGQDRVQLSIRNRSSHRLNVVIPPGLVASSAVGQPGGAGWRAAPEHRARLGLQSRGGLRRISRDDPAGGLQSVGTSNEAIANQVAVPVGETVELDDSRRLPQLRPSQPRLPRNTFRLVDVNEYTLEPPSSAGTSQPGDLWNQPRGCPGRDVERVQ